jgi:nitrogen fixation protein
MNAFQIVFENGTSAMVYTPRKDLPLVITDADRVKGCSVLYMDANGVRLDLTQNMKNQAKWNEANADLKKLISSQDEALMNQLYQQIYPKALEDAKKSLGIGTVARIGS